MFILPSCGYILVTALIRSPGGAGVEIHARPSAAPEFLPVFYESFTPLLYLMAGNTIPLPSPAIHAR